MLALSPSFLLIITKPSSPCNTSSVTNPKVSIIRSSSTLREADVKERESELSSADFPVIKAAKRVVLVRHGQSTWNAEGRIQGSSNFSVLTPKGESQAETSRQMLLDDSFDVCFTRLVETTWVAQKGSEFEQLTRPKQKDWAFGQLMLLVKGL